MRHLKDKELLIIIIIYVFITIKISIQNVSFYINVLNTLFWAIIVTYLTFDIKKGYIRFFKNKQYYIYMIIILILQMIITFNIGFIRGFVKSPYNHDIISILQNIIIEIIPIVGIELTRIVIISRNRNNKKLIVFLTIILIVVEIKYNILISIYSNRQSLFEYICSTILPLIACNILYTYFTLKVSYLLPLIYRIFNRLSILLLPILPDVDWFIIGTINILSPTLMYILFKYNFTRQEKNLRKKKENLYTKIVYTVTIILCITLICFMLGIFNYEPISILSNSMYPAFTRGDVVIYKKLSNSELENIPLNAIIIYSIGEQNIAHRVIKIIKENGNVLYKTKGDYNNGPDMDLVQLEQIKGIYVFHIKYIGYPSIWLYDYFNNSVTKVETK